MIQCTWPQFISFAVCGDEQQRCLNGLCVDKALVCDGNNDCGDNSDEELSCGKFRQIYTLLLLT